MERNVITVMVPLKLTVSYVRFVEKYNKCMKNMLASYLHHSPSIEDYFFLIASVAFLFLNAINGVL